MQPKNNESVELVFVAIFIILVNSFDCYAIDAVEVHSCFSHFLVLVAFRLDFLGPGEINLAHLSLKL